MAPVLLTDDAKDDIRALDGSVRARIAKDLKKLENSPSQRGEPLGSQQSGNLTSFRKMYVGPKKGYRAVFLPDGDQLSVVLVVAEREDQQCYEMAVARIRLLSSTSQRAEVVQLLKMIQP